MVGFEPPSTRARSVRISSNIVTARAEIIERAEGRVHVFHCLSAERVVPRWNCSAVPVDCAARSARTFASWRNFCYNISVASNTSRRVQGQWRAQAAQFVRIILRFREFRFARLHSV